MTKRKLFHWNGKNGKELVSYFGKDMIPKNMTIDEFVEIIEDDILVLPNDLMSGLLFIEKGAVIERLGYRQYTTLSKKEKAIYLDSIKTNNTLKKLWGESFK